MFGGGRFIRWSDGSLQLQVGEEVLDAAEHKVVNDHSFLFIRHNQVIQARTLPWTRQAVGSKHVESCRAYSRTELHSSLCSL